jgi:hypothetical protein
VAGVLGGLTALVAAMGASWYVSAWPEDRSWCGELSRCPALDADAAFRLLWWPVGLGLAVLAAAAVLLAASMPPRLRSATGRPLAGPVHALVAGLVALGSAFLLGVTLLIAAFVGPHLLVVALTAAWPAQAAAVVLAGRLVRAAPRTSRAEWVTALLVSALGVGAVVLVGLYDARAGVTAFPVVDALVVAIGVLVQRSVTGLAQARRPTWPSLAGGVAVLTVGAVLLLQLLVPGAPGRIARLPVVAAAPATPTPAPTTPTPAPATPTPAPTPAVAADAPCAQSDLTFSVGGFDAAMGARAAALVATNTGASSCWLEGVPVVVLLQGGRPLALQVGPGQTAEGAPATSQRVGVAPGGTAVALLTWRSYGGWADLETPQAVTVALDASTTLVSAALPAGAGAAPFDIADGGAWGIAPWAPPWN